MAATTTRPAAEQVAAPTWMSGAAAAAGLVIAVTLSVRPGIGLVIAAGAIQATVLLAVRDHPGARRLVVASVALIPILFWRDNQWLMLTTVFALVVVDALALLVATRQSDLFDLPVDLRARPAAAPPARPPETASIQRGALLALPVFTVLWLLLAAADDVFDAVLGPANVPYARVILGLFAAATALRLLLLRRRPDANVTRTDRFRIGITEATIVLGSVAALFAAFVMVRAFAPTAGLTQAELKAAVRGGFFQLLWVAALTVVLVLVLRARTDRATPAEEARFRALAVLVIVLAGAIDIIALARIDEYIDRSFQSPLRFWSFGFGCWLLVVLAALVVRIGPWRSSQHWFTATVVLSWAGFVLAMGAINPDLRIAEHNLTSPPAEEFISVKPLMWLSEDATPTIVEHIDLLVGLPNRRYERMVEHLCSLPPDERSWRDVQPSRADARTALAELCPEHAA